MVSIFTILISIILFLEFFLFIIVKKIRNNFQWLITEKDNTPLFEDKDLKKFFSRSFDKNLGWSKKPKIIGYEKIHLKKTKFTLDKEGARNSQYKNFKNKIEAYGDSYVFGRFVKDNNVWTEYLSKKIKHNIKNFGVGNYGFDQSLLRYKQNKKNKFTKLVIIGFVPETINRIQSVWKHYLEFGNIYAIKPIYVLKNKKIKFIKNPIKHIKDFNDSFFPNIEKKIKKYDLFFLKKYKKFQFRKPYLFSYFRNFNFNIKLSYNLVKFLFNTNKKKNLKQALFPLYYEENIQMANKFYQDKYARSLLYKLIIKFKKVAKSKKNIPVLIVFPQKVDIQIYRKGKNCYTTFFQNISFLKVIDLTKFLSDKNLDKIYLDEEHGGHLTNYGNKLVANEIYNKLNDIKF